jgi:hypothetical protein
MIPIIKLMFLLRQTQHWVGGVKERVAEEPVMNESLTASWPSALRIFRGMAIG